MPFASILAPLLIKIAPPKLLFPDGTVRNAQGAESVIFVPAAGALFISRVTALVIVVAEVAEYVRRLIATVRMAGIVPPPVI